MFIWGNIYNFRHKQQYKKGEEVVGTQGTKFAHVCAALAMSILGVIATPLLAFGYTGIERTTDSPWKAGMVVAVEANDKVTPASIEKNNYIGVVAADTAGKSVEIANSGTVPILVTDADGTVAAGTKLGLSTISGVASTWSNGTAIAVAQDTPTQWEKATISTGKEVRVARVNAQLLTDGASTGGSPVSMFVASLEKTAGGIAGKPVDTWRVVTALLIAIGGLVLAFGLLFISSRESFFSLGRNPMASTVIMKGLWKVAALSIGILCVTLFGAYLIVRIG